MSIYTIEHTWDAQPIDAAEQVHLTLQRTDTGDWSLTIDAPHHGDPPPSGPPGRFWRLWQYEVVELFFVAEDGSYLEAEFGPHGHHLLMGLSSPREIVAHELPVDYESSVESGRWVATALLSKDVVPGPLARFNCFAIHGQGEERRYLAWSALPGDKPDFHQTDCFPEVSLDG